RRRVPRAAAAGRDRGARVVARATARLGEPPRPPRRPEPPLGGAGHQLLPGARGSVEVILISTYDMGRQPFGLASPAAWLREAGVEVTCVDLTREKLGREQIELAELG